MYGYSLEDVVEFELKDIECGIHKFENLSIRARDVIMYLTQNDEKGFSLPCYTPNVSYLGDVVCINGYKYFEVNKQTLTLKVKEHCRKFTNGKITQIR